MTVQRSHRRICFSDRHLDIRHSAGSSCGQIQGAFKGIESTVLQEKSAQVDLGRGQVPHPEEHESEDDENEEEG